MEFPALDALSPLDGRYRKVTEPLAGYFSEGAIIRYRIKTEVEYFIALCELPLPQLSGISAGDLARIRQLYLSFEPSTAESIKGFEKTTNHDIKALENFLRQEFDRLGLGKYKEFIHFGLTSQDINNTAFPLALKDAFQEVIRPKLNEIKEKLYSQAREWKEVAMLARTHGQAASPTLMGKEIYVFVERLQQQLKSINQIAFSGKFGGANGNMNAHYFAYPDIPWHDFAKKFLKEKLGLERQATTTQIEHYDQLAAFLDNLKRINTILIDLNRDLWTYISMDYFGQKINSGEVGSSTMPHKVNPIDFENSEGNLGLANAILAHLSAKLPISRLQRDLTDSTVIRNLGVPLAHSLLAYHSLLKGLNKLILNEGRINQDLQDHWAVVAEAIQTLLRREGYPNPYETLKKITRKAGGISQESIISFIEELDVSQEVKNELLKINPADYTGRFVIPEHLDNA